MKKVKLTLPDEDDREFIFDYVGGDVYSITSWIGSSGKTEKLFFTREELEQMGKLEDMENDIEET